MGDEFVSFEVAKIVLEQYSYRYNQAKSCEDVAVFDNFKPPYRLNMGQITLQQPNRTGPCGERGYTMAKLVDVIACVHGVGSMGEAIAIIKLAKSRLH